MRRKSHVSFGKGPSEKDPNHGHLVGGLLHSGRGRRKRTRTTGTSPAAYFTSVGARGVKFPRATRRSGSAFVGAHTFRYCEAADGEGSGGA